MKAVGYLKSHSIDKVDALLDLELPTPEALGRDILVEVEAVSVNPVDTKVRRNVSPNSETPKILGWDAVGRVVAKGDGVEFFNVGDKVWYAGDITRSGSNAQFQLVDERIVGKAPVSLTSVEAAAMPLTAITAWELLFDRLDFQPNMPGEPPMNHGSKPNPTLLIVGAAGGVGSVLTQLATKLTTATVIGTASRGKTQQWVSKLGAHHVINHHEPMTRQIEELNVDPVTHVISLTHTDQHLDQLIEILAPQGKLALIDDPQKDIDIKKLKQKSLSLHWELMFTRSMFETWDMIKQHQLLNTISDLVDQGVIETTLGEHYGTICAENLRRAHALLESNKAVGKLVLEGF
jgi:NADPH2:quinone reductase